MPTEEPPPEERSTEAARPPPRAEGAVATLLLSAFGLGLSPVMPGTVASLATAFVLWIVPAAMVSALALALLLLLYGVGATLRFGGRVEGADGHGDPGWVVSDEVAGQALACVGAIAVGGGWAAFAAAFVLFRVFDIWKPGLIGSWEKLPGGVGVLMDDVAAGVVAGVLTVLLGVGGAWG